MSDEELDNLFRKSAEHLDPPFDPEAWKAMERKLDQATVRAPWYRRYWPLGLLLLLLLLAPLMVSQLKDETLTPAQNETAAVEASRRLSRFTWPRPVVGRNITHP